MKTELTPELLYKRHGLSYPQIDSLLGSNHKDLYQRDIMENFKIIREFILVTDEFRKLDIRFISLKGPLLSHRIYNDVTVRRFHDLDILVDFSNISLIYNLLVQRGYSKDTELSADENMNQKLHDYLKHISFFHPQTKVCFEIHWKISIDKCIFNLDFDSIYKQIATDQVFMSRNFRILNKEYDLLYLLVHGSDHKWQRLKWLLDIKDYSRNVPFDRLKVDNLAKKHKVSRIIPLYNLVASKYFHDPQLFDTKQKVPALLFRSCIKQIEAREVIFYTERTISDSFSDFVYAFLLFPDLRSRLAYLKNKLICYYDVKNIETTNAILLILYRPFGLIFRNFHGVRKEK